jgi:hypothetical protein
MQAWRQMARADGGKVPKRWRWWVRALAKRNGWTFADAYLETLFGGYEAQLFRVVNHMGCVLQRHGIIEPWCCAFHQDGGEATDYCSDVPPWAEP